LSSEKEEKYSRILDAAIKVFAKNGVENSTIAKIASEAGVADGTIYLYFKNKRDILIQFAKDRGSKILAKFQEESGKGSNAKEKMINLLLAHLDEFAENRDIAIVFQAEISKFHSAEPYIRALSNKYRYILKTILENGKNEGLIDSSIDVVFVKNAISGAVNEIINIGIIRDRKLDTEKTVDNLVKFIFKGIGI